MAAVPGLPREFLVESATPLYIHLPQGALQAELTTAQFISHTSAGRTELFLFAKQAASLDINCFLAVILDFAVACWTMLLWIASWKKRSYNPFGNCKQDSLFGEVSQFHTASLPRPGPNAFRAQDPSQHWLTQQSTFDFNVLFSTNVTAFTVPNPNCTSQRRRFFQVWLPNKLPRRQPFFPGPCGRRSYRVVLLTAALLRKIPQLACNARFLLRFVVRGLRRFGSLFSAACAVSVHCFQRFAPFRSSLSAACAVSVSLFSATCVVSVVCFQRLAPFRSLFSAACAVSVLRLLL